MGTNKINEDNITGIFLFTIVFTFYGRLLFISLASHPDSFSIPYKDLV